MASQDLRRPDLQVPLRFDHDSPPPAGVLGEAPSLPALSMAPDVRLREFLLQRLLFGAGQLAAAGMAVQHLLEPAPQEHLIP